MTTPTREQVIEWAKAANILQTDDPLETNQWRQDLIRELEHFAASAYAAARAQALDDAAKLARIEGIPGISVDDDEIVADWLKALKGKP